MVFICHLAPRHFHPLVNNFIIELQAGVAVFFVLSGFLLCHRYYEAAESGKAWIKKYFINRFARIYPMYFIVTAANCIYIKASFAMFALNITFLHGYFKDFVFTLLPQNWSLTVEITFYLFIPFIFYLTRSKTGIIFQLILFITTGMLLTITLSKLNFYGLFADFPFMLVLTFFGRCFEFLAGVYLAWWLKQNKLQFLKNINCTYAGAFGLALSILSISLVGGLANYFGIFLHNIILPVNVALMIYGLINEKTIISRMLSLPFMQLLGKSSYTFFLIHFGIFHTLFYRYVISNLFLELIYTSVLSIILFKIIEQPLHDKSKALLFKSIKK